MPPEPGEIGLIEAAERLGVHYNTVYRYVRRGRLPAHQVDGTWRVRVEDLARLTERAATSARRGAPGWDAHRGRLLDRLIAGDLEGAWMIVGGALDAGSSPSDLHRELLGPVMVEIGERWERGDLEIEDEHRASAVAIRIVGRLSGHEARRGRRRGSVILGAAPGDHHSLPVAMMTELVRAVGFDAVDLGGDVPAASFARAVDGADRLVGVVVYSAVPDADADVSAAITSIRSVRPDVTVVVGGRSIRDHEHAHALGADAWGESPDAVIDALDRSTDSRPRETAT